ncbi:Alcohol dehydrogenase C-terminal [Penicillium canescens]|uniref:Alcohol dehydrogenase C-terminal n=1 Tax=Penicillium canescens TaxID=5083 RepID=A0AAD6HZV1_PENCN|nr:Alcohol dehydrogenase C-terminal [Penicillium canescens]KAJ5984909.1 Alcohol dehydrogenase C-terminal [Penicillium canescens]KAJ6023474.1 Alcohol dehydrogenase C-terminal [Penicillium canescens]KAJ6025253.1 Alcohol dehydrogenase C-terminal [Penicillium canescens]KAJ6042770.1 Alcohol dehydrogenase C-terminal [Penicillium canescens]
MSAEYLATQLAKRPETTIVPGDVRDKNASNSSFARSSDARWLDDRPSYIPPVAFGEIMCGHDLGLGSYAVGMMGWTEKAVVNESCLNAISTPDPVHAGRLTDSMGILGLTGVTAYWGMIEVVGVKPGDFVVVSGAAGATGTMAGQIAKIHDATVYGTAGSAEISAHERIRFSA